MCRDWQMREDDFPPIRHLMMLTARSYLLMWKWKRPLLPGSLLPYPFVPSVKEERDMRCEEILNIQAMGLKKRMSHIHCQKAMVGLSGGLDSTLALLVIARTFQLMGLPSENIRCVTMPCFGTTDRTYQNACKLSQCLGAALTGGQY